MLEQNFNFISYYKVDRFFPNPHHLEYRRRSFRTLGMQECVKCGKCVTLCPLYVVSRRETTSPRGMLVLIDSLDKGRIRPSTEIRNILKNCFLCGRCSICPVGIVPFERIADALVRFGGRPYRSPSVASLPRRTAKAETLILPGCVLQRNPALMRTVIKKITPLFADFAVAVDYCCGAPFLSRGDEKGLLFALGRLAAFACRSGAKRLVTLCPLCAATLKRASVRYSISLPGVFFINEVIGRPWFPKSLKKVFYFGGCVSEAYGWTLRDSLEKVGVKVLTPDGVHCCGGGEGSAPAVLRDMLLERVVVEWRSSGALAVLTDCPRCLVRFESAGIDASLSFSL